jgi:hypothetical protein
MASPAGDRSIVVNRVSFVPGYFVLRHFRITIA